VDHLNRNLSRDTIPLLHVFLLQHLLKEYLKVKINYIFKQISFDFSSVKKSLSALNYPPTA
jgi:hypothetical protein